MKEASNHRDREISKKKNRDKKVGLYGCLLAPFVLFVVLVIFQKGCDRLQSSFSEMNIKKVQVAEMEFGERWPLTVPSGRIYRIDQGHGRIAVVFTAPDGIEYGLNGTAQTMGYRDIHEITKQYQDSSNTASLYRDLNELISIGLNAK